MFGNNNQHKDVSLELQPRQVQNLTDVEPGMTVICESGVVWLTESDDLQDYTLRSGHSVTIRKKGTILIEAIDKARVHIEYPN